MYGSEIRQSDPTRLANILEFAQSDRPWQPGELSAVLRHQLAAPLEFGPDLGMNGTVPPIALKESRPDPGTPGQSLVSIGDLLRHPHPPIGLLEQLKAFAKAQAIDPHHVIPHEIAAVLYYAAIFAALLRCDRRITDLDNESLQRGLAQFLECTWLDEFTSALFADGKLKLANPTEVQRR
jgi:hypothetical protein